ncbi:N-acetylneuraminate synthase family protein [Thiomicrorhabdus cannonii]|uniref:N-acetylneuraminate synthase family protein n=1 Tax=Thiomicrorhabdus cannonii TaxID=2748011 RepID=UPI0015C064AB|nr:N-acetylneuraminate synthase family protein [Thiomicrorhabdus cannonii]
MREQLGYWQSIQASGRPLFLPDIGTYFNQDMAQAERLVDALAEAGVTTIKGEILQTADICLPAEHSGEERYWGHRDGQVVAENYRALIERKVVPLSSYETLFRYAQRKGMDVIVSVYDFEGADFAREIGCKAIKIASSNITHQPLIEHVATLGLPMIFDTGHSTLEEAARAVNWAQDQGAWEILVEHSPKGPPNPVDQQNLRFMQTLGQSLGVAYGLSDHHGGNEMLLAATALGASVLEKGVCPDTMGNEQDGGHAMPISQVGAVLRQIHMIADALGDGLRHLPRRREKYVSRMGLIAGRDLQAGEVLSTDTVSFAFPAKGIKTEYWSEVVGHRLNRPLKAGEVIHWAYVQFNE